MMCMLCTPRFVRQDYIQVNVGSTELRANPNITQIVEVLDEMDKRARLFAVSVLGACQGL